MVFNYGLVCSNFHWEKQIEYFDRQGFSILIYDYRGHYQSSGKHNYDNITFRQLALDLSELLEHIGLTNVTLLGHSMGVNVCLEFARLYPEKASRMILISDLKYSLL